MPAIRRTDSCTAARFLARPSSSTPVPRPTQAAVSPPASAAAMAADGVVLPMPDLAEHQQVAVEAIDGM